MLTLFGYRLAIWALPRLPVALVYACCWLAGSAAYLLAVGPRRAVQSNLRRVLGPRPDAGTLPEPVEGLGANVPSTSSRRPGLSAVLPGAGTSARRMGAAVRGAFRTAAYNYADMFLIPATPPYRLVERLEIVNSDLFLDAYRRGRGVIITTAHFGNFDLLVQISVAYDVPVTVLVEPLSPPELFRLVTGLRAAHGVRFVAAGPEGLREVLRVLRGGGVVAIAGDRDIQSHGVPVPFFGEPASLPSGAVELALRTGAELVPAFGLRLPGRRYRITVEPPLVGGVRSHDRDLVRRYVAALAGVMQGHIAQHPEQWVVFQPVWERRSHGAALATSKAGDGSPLDTGMTSLLGSPREGAGNPGFLPGSGVSPEGSLWAGGWEPTRMGSATKDNRNVPPSMPLEGTGGGGGTPGGREAR